MAIFHVMKYDVKCTSMCIHKFDCRETTVSNAANHFKIFLIEFEICLYKHLYFLYIRNPLFPIAVFISMLWQLKVNMFYPKKLFSNLSRFLPHHVGKDGIDRVRTSRHRVTNDQLAGNEWPLIVYCCRLSYITPWEQVSCPSQHLHY